MKESHERSMDTRERLLQAAGEIFASNGFRASTVREISRRAKANVAAVNYHFGDKKGLYSAVLQSAFHSAVRKYPPDLGLNGEPTLEKRLHAFIRSFLFRILDEGRPAWHGKLMVREMAEPTSALDGLVDRAIRPLYENLSGIVLEILGGSANAEAARLCTQSIIGQCLFYYYAKPVISRLHPQSPESAEIEELALHITRFSLNALRAIHKSGAYQAAMEHYRSNGL